MRPHEIGNAALQRSFRRMVRWPPLACVAEPALTECAAVAYRRRKVCRMPPYYAIGRLESPAQPQLPAHLLIDLTRST
jgi:hypothetical protein